MRERVAKKIGCEYEYNLRPMKSSWRIWGRCWERPSAMALTVPARCCSWWVCQERKAQTSLYLGCFSRLYFSSNFGEVKSPSRKNSRLTMRRICQPFSVLSAKLSWMQHGSSHYALLPQNRDNKRNQCKHEAHIICCYLRTKSFVPDFVSSASIYETITG